MVGLASGDPRPKPKRHSKRPAEEADDEVKENNTTLSNNSLNSTFFDSPAKKLKFDDDGDDTVTPSQTPSKQSSARTPAQGTPSILRFFFDIGQKKKARMEQRELFGNDATPTATPVKQLESDVQAPSDGWPRERERLSPDTHSILVRAPSSVVKRKLKVGSLSRTVSSMCQLQYSKLCNVIAAYSRGNTSQTAWIQTHT